MNLYAYVDIFCIQDVRFPYFLKVLHQQARIGKVYRIECFSFAEVDYYRALCKKLPNHLIFVRVVKPEYSEYRQLIDGGPLSTGSSNRRNQIDGKDFNPENPIRCRYIAKTF